MNESPERSPLVRSPSSADAIRRTLTLLEEEYDEEASSRPPALDHGQALQLVPELRRIVNKRAKSLRIGRKLRDTLDELALRLQRGHIGRTLRSAEGNAAGSDTPRPAGTGTKSARRRRHPLIYSKIDTARAVRMACETRRKTGGLRLPERIRVLLGASVGRNAARRHGL